MNRDVENEIKTSFHHDASSLHLEWPLVIGSKTFFFFYTKKLNNCGPLTSAEFTRRSNYLSVCQRQHFTTSMNFESPTQVEQIHEGVWGISPRDKQFASICYSLSLRCGYFLSFYFVVLSSCVMFCFSRLHLSFSRLFPSSPVFHLLIGPVYLSSAFPVALCQIICSALSRVSALFSTVSVVSFRGLCSSPRAICFLCHLFMYQLIIKAFLVFFPGEISLNCVSGLRPALSLPPCLLLLLAITGYVRLDMLSGPFKWYKKKKIWYIIYCD